MKLFERERTRTDEWAKEQEHETVHVEQWKNGMSLKLAFARLLIGIVAFMVAATWATGAASSKPTPVEFWHAGDDALSERLAAQTESLFMRSSDFSLNSGHKPGTLIVTIPTNVEWERVDKRDQVRYTVEFSSTDGQKLGVRTG